jgi:hypothetical protein
MLSRRGRFETRLRAGGLSEQSLLLLQHGLVLCLQPRRLSGSLRLVLRLQGGRQARGRHHALGLLLSLSRQMLIGEKLLLQWRRQSRSIRSDWL